MALINCPECGKEISDTSKKCIYCGYSIGKHENKLKFHNASPKKSLKNLLSSNKSLYKRITIAISAILLIAVGIVVFALNYRLSDAEKADVKQVESAISAIGKVELNSKIKIISAENLYEDLSNKCRHHVKNRKELIEARKNFDTLRANETIKLIDKIGTVTLNSQAAIDKAQNSYNALTDDEKSLVKNSDQLLLKTKQLMDLKIEDVNSKISAIGIVTLNSEENIAEARKAYNDLAVADREKVNEYEKLTTAEKDYDKLALNNCITQISNIGKVSLDSKQKINNAEKLYYSLSKEAREKVTNYGTLASAIEKYEQLEKREKEKEKTLKQNDSFKTSKWKVTYKKTNISAKIYPNHTNGYYMYYYADDNETFVDIVFQIKNIDTDILNIEDLVGNCEVEYDGNTYTKNYNLYTSRGSDIDRIYSWDALDALDSTTLHVAISMPRELQKNKKSVKVKLNIAGQEKIINVR